MSTAAQTTNGHANGIDGAKTGPKIKSKNQLRRLKAKQKKAQAGATVREVPVVKWNVLNYMLIQETETEDEKPDVKMEESQTPVQNVEYVSEQLDGPALEAFSDVFARFQLPPESTTVRNHIYLAT